MGGFILLLLLFMVISFSLLRANAIPYFSAHIPVRNVNVHPLLDKIPNSILKAQSN